MRCRLCLQNLEEIDVLLIYNEDGSVVSNKLLELISEYLHLNIAADDSISTSVCQNCYDHIIEFDRFAAYVSEQQKVLFNEFLEVKCKISELDTKHEHNTTHTDDAVQDPLVHIACLNEIKKENAITLETTVKEEDFFDSSQSFCSEDERPLIEKKLLRKKKKKKTILIKHKKRKIKSVVDDDDDDDDDDYDDNEMLENTPKNIETKNREMIAKFMKLLCDICGMEAKDFRELRQHFNETHQQRAYVKCCGKQIYRLDLLATHVDRHQHPEKYT